ncbi:MAG: glycosyl hydrolase family 79 C-terminal domain-containing protein, partial [Solirubrobacteraceae bacterium]
YPLLACGSRPGTKRGVSPWDVLAPGALEGRAGLISGLVGYARRQGKSLRITESNSVACGGARGASDSFASALWGADWSFMVAAVRGGGVDFHMASPLYTPLSIGYTASGPAALVRPLYYGMLFFAEATAHRARLLSSSYRKLRTRNRANLNAWATYDRVDRVVRVAIINKDRRARGAVIVHVPHATGPGRLKRLRAPTVRSTRVSFGGQRFSEPSYDGQLLGTPRVPSVRRRPGSRFRVLMDGPGAALLTVPVRRPLR